LRASRIVSSGLILTAAGAIITTLRKSPRTGDVDVAAGFDMARPAQKGFQFQPAAKGGGNRILRPLTDRLENVLFEVHSALRDIDGLHAPDALDEICKLLYAKIFDEENAIKSGAHRFQRGLYHSVEECAASIRHLYYDAVKDDQDVFSSRIASYARSRGVFREPIILSSQALARTVSLLEEYDIGNSPVDIKGRAFQNVLIPATRAGMGQYFTPKAVISLCISLLSPTVRDVIVDPFCGSGHFLTAALDYVRKNGHHTEKQFHEFAFSRLHGLEKSDRMVRIAMTDMRLHGDGHSNIRCVDSLLPFVSYADLYPDTFDIVATNPPFGIDLPQEAISELGPFDILSRQRGASSSVSLEIVALDRCLSLLRPGGRMAIVLPDGILSNRSTGYVREWVQKQGLIRAIISLPIETFTPFGANIKTSALIIRKFYPGEDQNRDYGIFLADLKFIGHDAAGRPAKCDDFEELRQRFSTFIAEEGW
jgi:type I restriction enzyme M protein